MVKQSIHHFGVCVKILEASDLPHPDISSLACVDVGGSKKCTKSIKNTNKPRFNEYFVFDLKLNFMTLMNTLITISLFEPVKAFSVRKLIGTISMEVSTVWAHEGRRMKRWLVVTLPSDVTSVHRGFVHCDINIEASEQFSRIPLLTPLDMPNVIGGTCGRYMVRIYHCIGLDNEEYVSSKTPPDVSVRVSFGGRSETTTKRKLIDNAEWNEQITFVELVPPLYQKITIELIINKKVLATKDFYLYKISHVAKKDGFYPTYGPTYVHFYEDNLSYHASLMMAIETEHISLFKYKEKLHAVLRHSIQPTYDQQLRKMESFLLFGVVFEVVFNDNQQTNRPVHLRLSFGKPLTKMSLTSNSATRPYKVLTESTGYPYLPLNEQKPCLFLRSSWPDTRHRLANSNAVARLANFLRERVDYAQNLMVRGSNKEAEDILKAAMRYVKSEFKSTLEHLAAGVTKLDAERVNLIRRNFKILTAAVVAENNIESLMDKSSLFLSTLESISEGMQDSLPNVVLGVYEGNSLICFCVVHPREILFSKSDIKKGEHVGKIVTLTLEKEDHSEVGQLHVWLWLGLWSDVSLCLRLLPLGHEDITNVVTLPFSLAYETDYKYALICHIMRGVVSTEDDDGRCDPYVSVVFSRYCKQTKTIKLSLTPLWKDTLLFNNVRLYPSPLFLEENPPSITVELLDGSDKVSRSLGTTTITPKLRLHPLLDKLDYSFQWYRIGNSQILAFFETILVSSGDVSDQQFGNRKLSNIAPEFIDPPTVTYRLEIVFWGIRGNDVGGLRSIVQPQATVQCGSAEIKSEFVIRANKALNFKHDLHIVDLDLPKIKLHTPPLSVRLMTSAKYFGTNIETNVYKFLYNPPSQKIWKYSTIHRQSVLDRARSRLSTLHESMPDLIPLLEQTPRSRSTFFANNNTTLRSRFIPLFMAIRKAVKMIIRIFTKRFEKLDDDEADYQVEEEVEEELDWWFRYYFKEMKIYITKLEDVKDFRKFNDVLKTFPVQQKNQEAPDVVANVKVMICLYKWPVKIPIVTRQGMDPGKGVLKYTELSERAKLLVRVYCIKATNLHPADPNGKADPFIEIATPSKVVSDESNHINQQLNPVFGKCLEIRADFPVDTVLAVRVMDYDRISSHDLIGETVIDLENRFYSDHRATCGLASTYSSVGYDQWRDVDTPVTILEKLCNSHNLPLPQYYENSVVVSSKEFNLDRKIINKDDKPENLALQALRNWHEVPVVGLTLVPEHVETRPIYNHKKRPGIEQGRLEMWVDIFDLSLGEVPPPLDITPRKPQPYELRVIVWNTANVPLLDNSFFVGKKHTDIFVKCWLWDSSSAQTTDVHYTSVNGTGNFNWRFIFPMLYLRAEKRMVIYKQSIFEVEPSEIKVPALINLQIWDKDRLSANDFIGSMEMELCKMPRGARSARACKVQPADDAPDCVDLFRVKRLKGWWPFIKVKDGVKSPAGLLQAEFHLLTGDEATAAPAGLGRSEPDALSPPLRPTFKVKFWLAPLRMLCHYLCGVHKGKVLLCLLTVAVSLFLVVGIYSIPMFVIKKIIGA